MISRQERERRAMEEEIVRVALTMIRADGAANLSMRRIAQEIEYSSAALYRYFKDKSALVDRVCELGFQQLATRLQESSSALPFPERLIALGEAYIQFAVDEPHLYTLMFVHLLPDPPNPRDHPEPTATSEPRPLLPEHLVYNIAFAVLHTAVTAGAEQGGFRPTPEERLSASIAVWALVHGYAMLRIRMPLQLSEPLLRSGLRTMMNGLLTGPTADR